MYTLLHIYCLLSLDVLTYPSTGCGQLGGQLSYLVACSTMVRPVSTSQFTVALLNYALNYAYLYPFAFKKWHSRIIMSTFPRQWAVSPSGSVYPTHGESVE
jgi:hypothetical protein